MDVDEKSAAKPAADGEVVRAAEAPAKPGAGKAAATREAAAADLPHRTRVFVLLRRDMTHPVTGERLPAGRVAEVPRTMAERLVKGGRAVAAADDNLAAAGPYVSNIETDPNKED